MNNSLLLRTSSAFCVARIFKTKNIGTKLVDEYFEKNVVNIKDQEDDLKPVILLVEKMSSLFSAIKVSKSAKHSAKFNTTPVKTKTTGKVNEIKTSSNSYHRDFLGIRRITTPV